MTAYRAAVRLLSLADPETAHGLSLWALAHGLAPVQREADDPVLATRVWGRDFANPVGLAAGFDKDAVAADALLRAGFGFVEVGSITPRPQPGNPKPRIFRLRPDLAVINRLGFNSRGAEAARGRLEVLRRQALPGPLGVNLGKNKESADAAGDYAAAARLLAPFADYLVVNVSSPNTPGLRALQGRAELEELIDRVRAALAETSPMPPLVLKIAPDLAPEDLRDIAAVSLERGLDGLIATNTTIARPPELVGRARDEAGGLSGRPLFGPSTRILAETYRLTEGRIPIVGVGGIASGADAYAKIRAGASLVQLYTALIYEGPRLVRRIKRELAELLRRDGFARVQEAVGADER
jgi:dihydroorotate dehydrogenase